MSVSSGAGHSNIGAWVNAKECGACGSECESIGATRAGSNEVVLEDVADFQVGQWVTVSRCHLHYYGTIYNTLEPYFARNQRTLGDEIVLRGLDEERVWQTFLVHFDKTDPVTFRWMAVDPRFQTLTCNDPVLSRHWDWQGTSLPISGDWVTLVDGVQMRFRKRDWLPGQSISFHARNRLLARIVEIRGNTLVLSEQATRSASNAVVRHHDQAPLQAAVDRAIAERKGLYIPAGRYRLSEGLWIWNASLQVEGAGREHTTLDVSEDNTSVFWIGGGKEVAIRNLGMTGHTGFMELPANESLVTATGYPFWVTANEQMQIKGCAAVNAVSTEHLLFEDLKVTRMASEAFYLHGSDRYGTPPYVQAPHEGHPELQEQYTKSCVFHRCHVSDCGFNAFNNNDHAENTSILNCHVERVTNFCENASRFTRIIGNYVLDGCATSVHAGTIKSSNKVAPNQAIIADNVFEGGKFRGGIWIDNSATQVVVANNLFVGYSKESAIFIVGGRRIIVTGNHIDLTQNEENPDNERCGICVETSNVLIADNHIYVRGQVSEKVTGINIADHAVNVHIHDNLIENCHCGLRSGSRVYVPDSDQNHFEFQHTESEVIEVAGARVFRAKKLPVACDGAFPYRKWGLRWLTGPHAGKTATIESYGPEDQRVALVEDLSLHVGDRFVVYPRSANWQIHHNTIVDCERAVFLDLIASEGVRLQDNTISP